MPENELADRLKIKLGKNREAEAQGRFAITALVVVVTIIAAVILLKLWL